MVGKSYRDIGKDGATNLTNLHQFIGQDEMGYSLNYFAGDYYAIGQGSPRYVGFVSKRKKSEGLVRI